jgi:DNA-binding CsgD family transcriptional regulator/tetratricopeptide (TPR) repeat protein
VSSLEKGAGPARTTVPPELPLVGRADALAVVLDVERDTLAGRRRVLGVFGEAGVGKSRLIDELPVTGHLAQAACQLEAAAPYASCAALWRQLAARDPVVLRRRPELQAALSGTGGTEPTESDLTGTEVKRRLFDAAADAIVLYSARAPVKLIVEDVQWSDLASLELVYHLALVTQAIPFALVLTARENELDEQRQAIVTRLMRLPGATELRLAPLAPVDAEAVIDHEQRRHSRELTREQRRAIVTIAAGNPLYLRELTRHAGESGAPAESLPTSVGESIRTRLRGLPADVQGTLRAASALGEFDEDLVARVTGRTEAEAAAALRAGIDAGFLVRPDRPWLDLRFSHELVRRAVHDDALPAERRRLHRAMLRYLDSAPQADPSFTRRALHAWAAGDRALAAVWNERAGDAAFARSAFADAADLYHRANAANDAADTALLDKEALALERAGRPAAALPLLERCLAAYAERDRARVRVLLRIARAEFRAARRDEAASAIERARSLLGKGESSAEHYAVHVFRAWLAATEKRTEAAFAALAEAEPHRAHGDREWWMRAHEASAIAFEFCRDLPGWRASYEGMVALAESSGEVVRHIGTLGNFANSAFYLGETALALDLDRRAFGIAEREHCLDLVPHVLAIGAHHCLMVGDLIRAQRMVELVLPACVEFPTSELIATGIGIVVAVRSANAALLARCLREELLENALRGGVPWQLMAAVPALTELHAASDRFERARSVVRTAIRALSSGRDVGGNVLLAVAEYGLVDEFPHVADWMAAETAAWPHTVGFLHLYRAFAARGGAERERHARAAADAFRNTGYRWLEARSHEIAGDLSGARRLYAACGAARNAARLGERGRAKLPSTGQNRLTPREEQVAELVAAGMSNRETGGKLSLSDRTVEHHLGAVFAKLGVRSRAELAAVRARERPIDPGPPAPDIGYPPDAGAAYRL